MSPGSFTTRDVDSGGVRLATRDYGGTAPALVLMHGAGMEQSSLEPLAEHLRATFRVITFDFRGHGSTDPAPWTFASALHDLRAVTDAYRLGTPAVGGHSLGGMVATAYGLEQPTCPGVINIDGHGRGRVDQYVGHEADEVRTWWGRQDRRVEHLTRGPGALAVRVLMLLQGKRPATTGATLRQVMLEVDSADLFAMYRRLECPLLVFNATAPEDRPVNRRLAGRGLALVAAYREGLRRDLAALAADNELVEVATLDATHMLVRTHAEAVARRVARFLQPRYSVP